MAQEGIFIFEADNADFKVSEGCASVSMIRTIRARVSWYLAFKFKRTAQKTLARTYDVAFWLECSKRHVSRYCCLNATVYMKNFAQDVVTTSEGVQVVRTSATQHEAGQLPRSMRSTYHSRRDCVRNAARTFCLCSRNLCNRIVLFEHIMSAVAFCSVVHC